MRLLCVFPLLAPYGKCPQAAKSKILRLEYTLQGALPLFVLETTHVPWLKRPLALTIWWPIDTCMQNPHHMDQADHDKVLKAYSLTQACLQRVGDKCSVDQGPIKIKDPC